MTAATPVEPVEVVYEVRWDDADPNGHLRHTGYGTYAAQARMRLFEAAGIEVAGLARVGVAPILFREELVYRRELRLGENVRVTAILTELTEEASRWSIRSELFRPDGPLAATVAVDGAWIDLATRKLANPPEWITRKLGAYLATADSG